MRHSLVAKNFSHFWRVAIYEECLLRRGTLLKSGFARRPVVCVPLRNREAFARIMDRGSEKRLQILFSKFREKLGPPVHRSGNRDGIDSFVRHCDDALIFEIFRAESIGGPSARVQAVELSRLR